MAGRRCEVEFFCKHPIKGGQHELAERLQRAGIGPVFTNNVDLELELFL